MGVQNTYDKGVEMSGVGSRRGLSCFEQDNPLKNRARNLSRFQ